MKTAELTGAALDWAVAKCEGRTWAHADNFTAYYEDGEMRYSTEWAQGGPIIEREMIATHRGGSYSGNFWSASIGFSDERMYGPSPLIAAMRCYVASKLGDTVDIPKELHP